MNICRSLASKKTSYTYRDSCRYSGDHRPSLVLSVLRADHSQLNRWGEYRVEARKQAETQGSRKTGQPDELKPLSFYFGLLELE